MTSSSSKYVLMTVVTKTHYRDSCKFTTLTIPLTVRKEVIVLTRYSCKFYTCNVNTLE